MTTQWEYIVFKVNLDWKFLSGTDFPSEKFQDELNARGEEGWELVSTFDIESAGTGSMFVMAVMKRPKS